MNKNKVKKYTYLYLIWNVFINIKSFALSGTHHSYSAKFKTDSIRASNTFNDAA